MVRLHQLIGLCIIAACTVVAATAQSQTLQKAALRLDWTALGYHAPFYLGVARGYYRDAGIELEIQEGKGSPTTITLVGNESIEFGFADSTTAALLISKGLTAKVVMGIFQRSTLSLFFPVGKGVAKPADLKGKRLLMCPGDGLIQYLPAYLKAINLGMDDIKTVMVDCGIKYSALAQGQADAVATYGYAGKPLLQAVGVAEVGKLDYADAGISLPSHGIVVSMKTIDGKQDLVRRFVSATAKAWLAAQTSPDDAVTAMVAANPLLREKAPLLKDTLVDSFQYLETPAIKGKPFGWQSPEEWTKAETTLVEYLKIPKPASVDVFFTNAFIAN
ncbi:MAG: ABC transporter substrate-binding protein [Alphaproteobacteria bacterium]|nr:ABC transporter substrate-binding protein [Alphaproteobacteria bacterium]